MLDKVISASTIVLLAPAILAVWLAIRSSTAKPSAAPSQETDARTPIIGQDAAAPGVAAQPPVILKIKPGVRAMSA